MTILRVALALSICVAVRPLHGQDHSSRPLISTDRPSESTGPGVVPRWALQFEAGYKKSRAQTQSVNIDTQEFPDMLVRVGVLETVEARFTVSGWGFIDAATGREDGFNDLSLGAKWAAARERGLIPQMALLAEVKVPVGDPGFTDDFANPKFLMLFTNTLTKRLSLTYNFGSSIIRLKEEETGERTIVDLPYTAMLSGSLGDDWSWFAELFGAIALSERADRHTFQAGVTTLVTDVVQLDVRSGVGLVDNVPTWLVGGGVAFRLFR